MGEDDHFVSQTQLAGKCQAVMPCSWGLVQAGPRPEPHSGWIVTIRSPWGWRSGGTSASPSQELALKLYNHQSSIWPIALTTRGHGKALARDKTREGRPRLEIWGIGMGVGLWKWNERVGDINMQMLMSSLYYTFYRFDPSKAKKPQATTSSYKIHILIWH